MVKEFRLIGSSVWQAIYIEQICMNINMNIYIYKVKAGIIYKIFKTDILFGFKIK